MGIKFFYKWLSQNYKTCIRGFKKLEPPADVVVDTFLIDMNGLFHNSAQRVFKYGNGAPKATIFRSKEQVKHTEKTQMMCFEDITKSLNDLVSIVKPRSTLVLAIDGVAPASKINQQRQRRFRSSMAEMQPGSFNPISITPGTAFMDALSHYIDWYIKKRISECDEWAKIKIVFSNEKQPGEGEHKLIEYIKRHGKDDETFCINALDADLVMLSLATFKPNFYLLREEQFSREFDYSYVSIGKLRQELDNTLFWEKCDRNMLVKDFILICFLCGNDFLPNIPSISILENGLDTMIHLYKINGRHLVDSTNKIDLPAFKSFLHRIGECEEGMVIQRVINRASYIPDSLLDKHSTITYISEATDESAEAKQIVNFDLDSYKKEYYIKKDVSVVARHDYLTGCQWVFTYYLDGVSDWTWLYKYNYAPFAKDIAESVDTYTPVSFQKTLPLTPFEQLLCVIPPKSSNLLPQPLDMLLKSKVFSRISPEKFVVNCEGKKFEYEGIVELPPVDIKLISREYSKVKSQINPFDISKRNTTHCTVVYTLDDSDDVGVYKSHYGNIKNYKVNVENMC
jgi:5'-3' exonuclease